MYDNIVFAHWILFSSLWLGVWLWLGLRWAKAFINDERVVPPKIFQYDQRFADKYSWDESVSLLFVFVAPVAGFVSGAWWPLFWVVAVLLGALFGSRALVRAKKTYLAHTHAADGTVR